MPLALGFNLLQIHETDYYPKYICESCLEELKASFYFKRKCEKSDVIFRKALSSETMMSKYLS